LFDNACDYVNENEKEVGKNAIDDGLVKLDSTIIAYSSFGATSCLQINIKSAIKAPNLLYQEVIVGLLTNYNNNDLFR
ncbi:7649_t:CDS:2, partial [Entrophospora sp. SA101]